MRGALAVLALPAALAYLLLRAVGELAWSVFGNNDETKGHLEIPAIFNESSHRALAFTQLKTT